MPIKSSSELRRKRIARLKSQKARKLVLESLEARQLLTADLIFATNDSNLLSADLTLTAQQNGPNLSLSLLNTTTLVEVVSVPLNDPSDVTVNVRRSETTAVSGNVQVAANHNGTAATTADGDAEGGDDAGIGIAAALAFVKEATDARVDRDTLKRIFSKIHYRKSTSMRDDSRLLVYSKFLFGLPHGKSIMAPSPSAAFQFRVAVVCLLTVGLTQLSLLPSYAQEAYQETPGTDGDCDHIVGPEKAVDPDLTDRGNPQGKQFEFSMPLAASAIYRGDDATLDPKKQVRKERRIFVYIPAASDTLVWTWRGYKAD